MFHKKLLGGNEHSVNEIRVTYWHVLESIVVVYALVLHLLYLEIHFLHEIDLIYHFLSFSNIFLHDRFTFSVCNTSSDPQWTVYIRNMRGRNSVCMFRNCKYLWVVLSELLRFIFVCIKVYFQKALFASSVMNCFWFLTQTNFVSHESGSSCLASFYKAQACEVRKYNLQGFENVSIQFLYRMRLISLNL